MNYENNQAVATFISPFEINHPGTTSHTYLVNQTLSMLESLSNADCYLFVEEKYKRYFREKLPDDSDIRLRSDGPQGPSHFNEIVEYSFNTLFEAGYDRVVAIGCDTPGLSASTIRESFNTLRDTSNEAVIGPSKDGGFYLLGLESYPENLISSIPFYTSKTFDVLLSRLSDVFSNITILQSLTDIDAKTDWFNVEDEFLTATVLTIIDSLKLSNQQQSPENLSPLESFLSYLKHTYRAPPIVPA